MTIYSVRTKDGRNFNNLNHPTWGFKKSHVGMVKKMKKGDIFIFVTNKPSGSKVIGLGVYSGKVYNREDECLIKINTKSNEEMGWDDNGDYVIQVEMTDVYNINDLNITHDLPGMASLIYFEPSHYTGFASEESVKN